MPQQHSQQITTTTKKPNNNNNDIQDTTNSQQQQQHKSSLLVDPRDFVPERLRVLVVDSRSSSRANIVTILQDCAYQVGAVGSTAEAVDILTHNKEGNEDGSKTERFDLVIKEHEPPKIKATKLLRLLKSDDVLRLLPVVVMSYQDDREIVLRCLHLGAVDYLVKPLRKNELRNIWTKVWLHKVVVSCQTQGQDVPVYYPEIGQLTKQQVEDLMTASSVEEQGSDEEDEHDPTSKEGSAPDRSETKYQGEGDRTLGTNGNSGTKDHNNGSNGNGESTTLKPENPRALMGTAEGGINDHNQTDRYLLKDSAGVAQQQSIAATRNSCDEFGREDANNVLANEAGKDANRAARANYGWDGSSIQPKQQAQKPHSGTQANQSNTLDKVSDDTHQPLTTATNKITSTSRDTNSLPLPRQQQQQNNNYQECILQQQLPQQYVQDFGLLAQQILQSQLLSPLAIISALQTLKQQQQSISHDNSRITFQQQQMANQLMSQYAFLQQQQQSLMHQQQQQQQQHQQQMMEVDNSTDAADRLLSQMFLRNQPMGGNNDTPTPAPNPPPNANGNPNPPPLQEKSIYGNQIQENSNKGFRNWQPKSSQSTGKCSEPQTPSLIYPSFSRCTKSLPVLGGDHTQSSLPPCSLSASSNPPFLNQLLEFGKQQNQQGKLIDPNQFAAQQNLLAQQQLLLDQEINMEKKATRQKAIDRFRIKKKNFHFGKRIRYETRRELAQQRSRHKGQFTSKRQRIDDATELAREIKYQRIDDDVEMNAVEDQGTMDTITSKQQMQNIFNQEGFSRQGE